MKRGITFTVTEDDLHKGVQGDCYGCASAVALKRQGATIVEVDAGRVKVDHLLYETSNELVDFIEAYDDGFYFLEGVEPFKDRTFTLFELERSRRRQ